jgi:hypothetical protein
VAKDLTKPEMGYARNYAQGEVVHFSKAIKSQGIEAGTHLSVESINRQSNTLTLRGPGERRIEASPARWKGAQLYRWEDRTIAIGDRLQFRIPDQARHIANGEFATITELDHDRARLRFDNNREIELPLAKLRHTDYGYAVTSHSSQGATVDRVIINVDSMRSAKLVNQPQFYVSISRPRHDAQVFTNDLQALERAVGRNPSKKVAMEVVKPAPVTTELKPQPQQVTTPLTQRRTTSSGMRP